MTDIEIVHPGGVRDVPDLVHRVRGLRFFVRHLSDGITEIARREGFRASVDQRRVAAVFVDWVGAITAQKAASRRNRRDYIVFSAGLLIERLLSSGAIVAEIPAEARRTGAGAIDPAARHWPEGFLAVSYCLKVLDIVLEQEGLERRRVQEISDDMSTWWSFRENFLEDATTTIPFFDLMVGNRPNWEVPTVAAERFAMKSPPPPPRLPTS
jgi:hypothetical protein